MKRINRHSKHEEKTEKYSINQVFTGRKCPLGIPLKYNYAMSICRS